MIAWDPMAIPQVRTVLKDQVGYAMSGEDCVQKSQVIVIVNAMPELQQLNWASVGDRLVVDCWRCLKPEHIASIRNYRPLGQGAATNGETLLAKIRKERLELLTD